MGSSAAVLRWLHIQKHALVEGDIRTEMFDVLRTHLDRILVDQIEETILRLATKRGMTVLHSARLGGDIPGQIRRLRRFLRL
jgi:hypothetical protein